MGASFEQVARGDQVQSDSHSAQLPKSRPTTPSLLRAAPTVVLFTIAIADGMRSADTDLWGHIFFGRIVLAHHELWFHAPFSYACPPGPTNWIMHDWLGNLLMALIYDGAGIIGLKFAKLACVAAVMMLLSRAMAMRRASLPLQAIVLLVAALALAPFMQYRTYLADDVMLAALMAMLSRETYAPDVPDIRERDQAAPRIGAKLWLAVPMFALWANLHGGFFVGLIIFGLYAAVRGAQDLAAGKGVATAVRLGAISSAAVLATLLNPYGLRDWIVIVGVLRNPFTLHHISEFRPLLVVLADFHSHGRPIFPFVCAIAIMAGLVVTFALSPRADDLALFAIGILMSATALYAVRNTALAVITAAIPLCRHLDLVIGRLSPPPTETSHAHEPEPRMKVTWQIAVAVAALAIALRTGLISKRMPAIDLKPVGAVAFMRAHDLHGNILCQFGWGDYLLWHDAPRSKVFIESIFEAYYPHAVQHDYATVNYAKPGAARVLNEYPNDFVLMPTSSPAYTMMTKQAGWRLIYRDPVAALFARGGSRAARIPGVPIIHAAAPASFFP